MRGVRNWNRYCICAASALHFMAMATLVHGRQCDPHWLPGDGVPGVSGTVSAAVEWDPDGDGPNPPMLVVAGNIKVAGNVQAANLMKKVTPPYPPQAKAARIQGTVRFTAVISTAGTVRQLTLVAGHPLLVPAAMEAVTQWVYRPTLLNGQPVEVETTIDVNFTLAQ